MGAYSEALRLDPLDQSIAAALNRLRKGIDLVALVAAEYPALAEESTFDEENFPPAHASPPQIPGLPTDPTAALRFDPLGADTPSAPSLDPRPPCDAREHGACVAGRCPGAVRDAQGERATGHIPAGTAATAGAECRAQGR